MMGEPLDAPLDLAELTKNVKISGDACCFKMKKLWGVNKKKGVYEDKFVNPMVYFSFAISSDKDPKDLLERISFEWSRMDDQELMIKDLPSFSTEAPIAVYYLHNNVHMDNLMSELTTMPTQARDVAIAKNLGDPYVGVVHLNA